MKRDQLIEIATSALGRFDSNDVDKPISATALDSLDLMILRSALETVQGKGIPDDVWFASDSLAELLERIP